MYLPIGVESVVDFISAISELSIISKESTLFHVVVEACNGLRSLIIWDYSLSVWGILIATIRHPMRRTGRLASCQVTIPGLINIFI